jgi:hypothetical protein
LLHCEQVSKKVRPHWGMYQRSLKTHLVKADCGVYVSWLQTCAGSTKFIFAGGPCGKLDWWNQSAASFTQWLTSSDFVFHFGWGRYQPTLPTHWKFGKHRYQTQQVR